jgi:hypothetical protein
MRPEEDSESAENTIVDSLGAAEYPLVDADPVSFLRSLAAASAALAKNPAGAAAANARC